MNLSKWCSSLWISFQFSVCNTLLVCRGFVFLSHTHNIQVNEVQHFCIFLFEFFWLLQLQDWDSNFKMRAQNIRVLRHSEIKIYERKMDVLQDFFSLLNIWDFETALWKKKDCKMHIVTKKRLRDLWNSMTHGFKGTIHQPWHTIISLNISFFHIQGIFLTLYYVLIIGCLENLNCKVTLFSTGSTLASSKNN